MHFQRIAAFTVATIFTVCAPAHAYLCGDLNSSKSLSASDALAALKFSVGQNVTFDCGPQHQPLVTGQAHCFNSAGQLIACAGSGVDGELQRGAPRAFIDNGNGTVTDRGTGLQWEQFDMGGGIHDEQHQVSQTQAYSQKLVTLNAGSFAGHSDWRMPNISELTTLANLDEIDPSAYAPYFDHDCAAGCEIPNCSCTPSPDYEWSSTSYAPLPSDAWALEMRFGYPLTQAKDLDTYKLRAVRGGYSAADITNKPAFEKSCADVNNSDTITATDALLILEKSVGQPVELACILRSAQLATGQTDCFDETGLAIPCAGTGQDGELKRGVVRSFANNGDGTVSDQATGLVWEILSADSSIHDESDTYSWSDSVQSKIAQLNDASFTGHADWRAPNYFELLTLLNYGDPKSANYTTFFDNDCEVGCSNTQCSCLPGTKVLWSSTTAINLKSAAIRVDLTTGLVTIADKGIALATRGVRGGD